MQVQAKEKETTLGFVWSPRHYYLQKTRPAANQQLRWSFDQADKTGTGRPCLSWAFSWWLIKSRWWSIHHFRERERERESRIGSGSMEAIRINRECRDGKTQSRVSLSRIEAEQEELSTQSDHSDQWDGPSLSNLILILFWLELLSWDLQSRAQDVLM